MLDEALLEEDAGMVAARILEALRAFQDHEVVLQGALEPLSQLQLAVSNFLV